MRVIRERRQVIHGALVAYLVLLAVVTLTPVPVADPDVGAVPALVDWLTAHGIAVTYLGIEFAANVALFVPFGMLVGASVPRRHLWWTVALGMATSVLIELTQRAFLPSRVPDVRDVVANTAGALVGVTLLWCVRWSARRRGSDRLVPVATSADTTTP